MFQQIRLRRNASNGPRLKPNSPMTSPHINPKRLNKGVSRSNSYNSHFDSDEECSDVVPLSSSDNDVGDGNDGSNCDSQDNDSLGDDVVAPPASSAPASNRHTNNRHIQEGQSLYKETSNAQGRYYGSSQPSRFANDEEKSSFQRASEDSSKSKAGSSEQPTRKISAQQRRERGDRMREKEKKEREEKLRSQSSSDLPLRQRSSSSLSSSSSSALPQDRGPSPTESIVSDGISPTMEKKKLFLKLFKSIYLSDERYIR